MQQHDWNVFRVRRELTQRFAAGWRATPRASRQRWFRALTLGTAALAVLMVIVALAGKSLVGKGAIPGEAALDQRLLQGLPFGFTTALWIQTVGTDIPLMMTIFTIGGLLVWHQRPFDALTLLLAWVLVYVVVDIGWFIWHRERPTRVGAGLP